jgi:AraC family transcriptional regulator, ethanolamine operon transcriptional activator
MAPKLKRRKSFLRIIRRLPLQRLSFDEYAEKVREGELSFLMTGPSRSSWEVGHCEIDSIVLQFGAEGGPKILHGISRPDALVFVSQHFQAWTEPVIFDGYAAKPHDIAVLPPSSHFTIATFGPHRWFSLSLPTGLFHAVAKKAGRNDLEWIGNGKCVVSPSPSLAESVTRIVEKTAARSAVGTASARSTRVGSAESLLRSLVTAIGNANNLISLSEDAGESSRNIVSAALEYVRHHNGESLRVSDLARVAEVTSRTLLRAFKSQVGIGPARYLKLRQLNMVRHTLRSTFGASHKVTEVLNAHGVGEYGRFATEYRALFGERPSDTIRRESIRHGQPNVQEKPTRRLNALKG